MKKPTSCKKTSDSPGCSSSLVGQKNNFFWFGKSKCPGARLDLTVNFHHGHFIDPSNCPWVSEDDVIVDLADIFRDFATDRTEWLGIYMSVRVLV